MKSRTQTRRHYLLLLTLALISLYGCDSLIKPTNYIVDYYVSPQAQSYQTKTVALFPMAKDDTTDTGTFYSTNYFINNLEKFYSGIKFFIPSLDTLTAKDSLFITHCFDKVESDNQLNMESFNLSELRNYLAPNKPDAIIIGKVNNVSYRKGVGLVQDEFLDFKFRTIISCDFTYYLISLTDGKIIWRIQIIGEAVNNSYHRDEGYPPLDMAISNGIDLILDEVLPKNEIQ